jgi:hypothetical protein
MKAVQSLEKASKTANDLQEIVKTILRNRGCPSNISLEVGSNDKTLVVRGNVSSFYLRQIVMECVRRSNRLLNVVDQLDVADTTPHP